MLDTLANSGSSLLNALVTNPIGVSIILAIGFTLIWLKRRFIAKAQRNATKSQYAG